MKAADWLHVILAAVDGGHLGGRRVRHDVGRDVLLVAEPPLADDAPLHGRQLQLGARRRGEAVAAHVGPLLRPRR